VLAAGNWYLEPERVRSWTAALLTLGCVAAASWFSRRRASHPAARRNANAFIQSGIAFAALIMAVSLSVKLASALGAIDDADLPQRLTMVILGVFFVFTGNAMPKMLTPLSELQCDGARVQAVQRFTGWTWVLTGLAFAVSWLVWPPAIAQPVSLAVLTGGALAVMARAIRLRRVRHTAA
jgi:hypothetical protein